MGRAMLSKSLIQFSVDEQGCVLSLLFDLRPNYDGGNEEKESKRAKWLSEESLQVSVKRREVKATEKRKNIPI